MSRDDRAPSAAGLAWRLLRRARPHAGRILLTLLVIFAANAARTLQAGLIKPVIDALPSGGAERGQWNLGLVAALAVGLSVAMFAFGFLRDTMTTWLTHRVSAELRNDVVRRLAFLPLRFHHGRRAGDLVSRTTHDVQLTEGAVGFLFDDALVKPMMIACAVALVVYSNWLLALAALAVFPLYVLPLTWLGRRMRKARKRSLERLGDMTQTMVQTLGGIKVVKAFNMEEAQAAEFRGHNEDFFRRLMGAIRQKALGENLYQLFVGFGVVILLVGGGWLLAGNRMTPGDMAIFGIGLAMVNTSVRELSKAYNRMQESAAAGERVFELLDEPAETEHDDGEELRDVGCGVEIDGVTFAYDAEPVLRDITLAAAPGEVIALVGPTGAGKSTLCDLICRFYDPTEGSIRIGGRDLRTLRRSSLLARIAVVGQDPFLFDTTLRENIRYGRPAATDADIEEASRVANIHDFIAGLELGYETVVGERGAKLSGGQRQRVAIARAVLKDADILILDEATSALDSESERLVQEALQNLIRAGGKRRLTFVIAHRLSTVRDADRIVVLQDGRIVETGTHDELLALDGLYGSLYHTQFAA